jgi:hypothetical protein
MMKAKKQTPKTRKCTRYDNPRIIERMVVGGGGGDYMCSETDAINPIYLLKIPHRTVNSAVTVSNAGYRWV